MAKRPHGIRAQDWREIEYHRQQSAEYMAQRAKEDLLPSIEVEICCSCSFRPYPHIIRDKFDRRRHNLGERR